MTSACRLCLNSSSTDYQDYNSVDQKYFEVILPEIDINIITSPILCINCIELLRTAYVFKTSCLETERVIKSYIERVGGGDISLMDILTNKSLISFTVEQDLKDVKDVKDVKSESLVKLESSNDTETFLNNFYDESNDQEEKQRYSCTICNIDFEDEGSLKRHNHLRSLRCGVCNKDFSNGYTLRRHMSSHKKNLDEKHKKNNFDENLIESETNHNLKLNKVEDINLLSLQEIKLESLDCLESCTNCNNSICNCKNNLKCPTCGKIMGTKSSFIRHKLTHAKRKNFICDFCQKSFLTKLYLQRHINTTHLGVPRKRTSNNIFTCDTCGLTTNNKHTLIQHIRTHTGERPYKCDLCGKAFVQSSTLGTHKRTVHSTERLFTCEYCSKSFNTKGSLTKHILEVHMVDKIEKKFSCNFCGKKYRLQSQLTCHLKWHSSERQFSCDICGKPFVDRHSVKKHRVIHFSEKQHKCEICGKGFHQKYNIKIHMKVHSRVP